MQNIRSFVAVPITQGIQRRINQFVDRLKLFDDDCVKWVPNDSLHLTLKFLGDVDNREIPEVCRVLREECEPSNPFELEFQGAGAFPDLYRAKVLWINIVTGGEALAPLVQRLEVGLAKVGFKQEPRPYRAHLTIGRMKTGCRLQDGLMEAMKNANDTEFGVMTATEIQLIASFLEKRGASYTVMDRIGL